jgi:uncharacterized phage-associated protein
VSTARDWSDFYEEDEPLEVIEQITSSPPDAVTGRRPSVLDIAAAILEELQLEPVDAWKLQKLCYFIQGRSLAETGLPAFQEPVEAWKNGPVVDRLYQESRGRTLVTGLRGDSRKVRSDEILKEIVERTVRDYRGWSGRQLAELTHSQQPWLQAREGLAPDQRSRNKISLVSMREWFRLQESLPDTEDDDGPL